MVATGETVGLAEWIIDDICLVFIYIYLQWSMLNVIQEDISTGILIFRTVYVVYVLM